MNDKTIQWLDAIEQHVHDEADAANGDTDAFLQDYYAQTIAKLAMRGPPSAKREQVLELETRAKQAAPDDIDSEGAFLRSFYSSLLYFLVSALNPADAGDWVAVATERAWSTARERQSKSFMTEVFAGAIERVDDQYRITDQYVSQDASPLKDPLLDQASELRIGEEEIGQRLASGTERAKSGLSQPLGPGMGGFIQQKGLANKRLQEAEPPDHLALFIDEFEDLIQDEESEFEFEDLAEIVQWVNYRLSTDINTEDES